VLHKKRTPSQGKQDKIEEAHEYGKVGCEEVIERRANNAHKAQSMSNKLRTREEEARTDDGAGGYMECNFDVETQHGDGMDIGTLVSILITTPIA
jgi:hypothetical protein